MSAPDPSAETEPQPLTPEAQAILKRARRSFGVSVGILLLGFIAIGAALVYRATRDDRPGPEAAYAAATLAVPAGAEILSAAAADGLITVTFRIDGAVQLRIYDGATGTLRGDMALATP